jgi:DNA polymerase (family 10)
MDKDQVAAVLDEIGTLLALRGENQFRCQAYHNAARAIQQLEGDLAQMVAADQLENVPGIGATLKEKITALATTGQLPFYEQLKKETPAGLVEMLRLPGLGPKKIKALYDELGIENLDQLKQACEQGKVAGQRGFGAKTQQKILEGLEFLGQAGQRVRLDQAWPIAQEILRGLKGRLPIKRIEICGSLRRRKETINDIDILVSSNNPEPVMDRFAALPGVTKVLARGPTKISVELDRGVHDGRRLIIQADLRIVSDEQFPFALHYFTGSKEHNVAMRSRAQSYGLKLNEYELASPKKQVRCKEEADIFQALDLDYIPPELREQTGEIEAAAEHRLPRLLALDDLQGIFHCHTNASDGGNTLDEMATAAKALGYHYLGIADHSQSLTIAHGLTPARVRKQWAEIDALNAGFQGFTLFKGTECDILPDGNLDFDDALLEGFDYVVASVHTHFQQPEAEMTQRIIRAIQHPLVTMLGHATGRLLLRRDSYKVDLEAVLQAAAAAGTMIEINANPLRLDLDWIHCKRARALGVKLVINPDAHSVQDLELVPFGVDVARRGWLEKGDVFNTMTAPQIKKALGRGKKV